MNTEDEEFERIEREIKMRALPDAIHHTDTSETLEYIQGWNDCRAAMLAEQSAQQEPVAWMDDDGNLHREKPHQSYGPEPRPLVYSDTTPQPAQQGPVGEVNRYGLDSHGRKWHGIDWYDPNVNVPHGTKLYTTPQAQPAPVPGVVLREGQPTLVRDRDIKTTDVRLCVIKEQP